MHGSPLHISTRLQYDDGREVRDEPRRRPDGDDEREAPEGLDRCREGIRAAEEDRCDEDREADEQRPYLLGEKVIAGDGQWPVADGHVSSLEMNTQNTLQ